MVENSQENEVKVLDRSFAIERLRWDVNELEYLDESKDEIISLRVMAGGAGVDVDLPRRLLGTRIDLTARDTSPDTRGLYFTFYISVRDDGDDEYGDWPYCRIRSWVVDYDNEDRFDNFGGWFSVTEGDTADQWIFEWETVSIDPADGSRNPFSTGYVSAPFERINPVR
jgi:hypothetical protein